jgi:two-component system cell cycle response regulator
MKECMRPYDTLGRYGGEEFLIIASDVDGNGALALGERIRSIVESKPVVTQAGEVSVTVSLGAAVSTGTRNADPQMLLRLADQALYRAKDNGRNRCELADVPGSTALATATAGGIPLKPGPS